MQIDLTNAPSSCHVTHQTHLTRDQRMCTKPQTTSPCLRQCKGLAESLDIQEGGVVSFLLLRGSFYPAAENGISSSD